MRTQHKNIGLTLLLFIGYSLSTWAQSGKYITVRDFETWTSATLNYKYSKKLKIGISQELRLKDNSSAVDKYFTNGFAEYKLLKPVRLGAELRYIRLNDNEGNVQGYENHLRYAFYTSFQHKVSRLSLKYRLQFQSQNELGLDVSQQTFPTQKLRLKIGGDYNIRKWKLDPRVSMEIFRTLGDVNDFTKFRATIGTKHNTKKAGAIGVFYRLERDLNEQYPKTTNVLGLNYQFTVKRKKK